MKPLSKLLLSAGVVVAASVLGIGVAQAVVGATTPHSASDSVPSGVNEFGETFGPEGFGETFDLIAAVGDDGTFGYLRSEDLNGPVFASPEEAAAWMATEFESKRVIALYSSDGRTVVGSFTIESNLVPGNG
jgi:hypothetical protein